MKNKMFKMKIMDIHTTRESDLSHIWAISAIQGHDIDVQGN